MKINSLYGLTLSLLMASAIQVSAEEFKLLHESEINEAAVIDALAPEKSGRTRSFRPMDDYLARPPSASMLITFNTNSANLTFSAKQALDKVGRALNMDKLAEFSFVIEGHADRRGSYELNQHLSEERAAAVRYYLISMHDIDPTRLTAIGKGYTEPLNKDNPLAEENRRVTIVRVVK
ncbi:hypothetical protein W03_10600 [Nitrosomonas sp. PY1]|uniref:OmpA family protein n=1 Tax=Nitrosomonas sp. PY1 TaxID=1803906 RepID=UPI001FC7C55A|nr:OmpA family protein [Nitrosomonas sp. PY1]GKS69056.1 hypothetical protein W03_10600 [Nitrosomonas sp. PY1]